MSKRRKKSRFTKTDVNVICEMQRKIDAYEDYIMVLFAHTQKHTSKCAFMKGTEMDEWVNGAVRNIDKMKEEIEVLRLKVNIHDGEIEGA